MNQNQSTGWRQTAITGVIDEYSSSSDPHQQTLLRLLGVAEQHGLDPATVLRDYSGSLSGKFQRRIIAIADLIDDGVPVGTALSSDAKVVPQSTALAYQFAAENGLTSEVNQQLLASPMAIGSESIDDDSDLISVFARVARKYVIAGSVIVFVMLFVVPQFQAMFEEFAIELPDSMKYLIALSDLFVQLWFVFALIGLIAFVALWIRNPRSLTHWYSRWLPFRHPEPTRSPSVGNDLSIGWIAHAEGRTKQVAQSYLENTSRFGNRKRETAMAKIGPEEKAWQVLADEKIIPEHAAAIFETAARPESAAWIMAQAADRRSSVHRKRGLVWLKTFSGIAYTLLALFTLLFAVGLFSCLITIIESL